MFVISNFLVALADLINVVITFYIWVVIARAIVSWISVDAYHPVVRFLYQVTEPVLGRIRRVLPVMGGLDLSPMILIFALVFLQGFIVPNLHDMAKALK